MVRSNIVEAAVFAVLSFMAALLVLPFQVFDPANVSWLMQGDPATHFLVGVSFVCLHGPVLLVVT